MSNDTVKKALSALAGLAAIGAATLPPHTIVFKVCLGIMGVLGGLGITSAGTTASQAQVAGGKEKDA